MTLDQALREHMDIHGESMRALSLRAGLNPKAVSDIVNIPGLRPRHSTLVALSTVTGRDLHAVSGTVNVTYADLIARAARSENATLVSRLRWICRKAGWAPEIRIVCKQDVIDFFDRSQPAAFDLTPGSFATYRTQLVNAVSNAEPRRRKRGIADVGGIHAALHDDIKDSDLPRSLQYASGAFLVYLHDEGIPFNAVNDDTLKDYFNHRVANSPKSEAACEKHVREIARLTKRLATMPTFIDYGFASARHPFEDGRDKFGVETADLAALLEEFDESVSPWAQGLASDEGVSFEDFIARLDAEEAQVGMSDRLALLQERKKAKAHLPGQSSSKVNDNRKERLRKAGFLVGDETWSKKTLSKRRGYIVSLSKALGSAFDMVPTSLDELLHPDFLGAAISTLAEMNEGEFPSGYAESILKVAYKIARDYQRRPSSELREISDLISEYKVVHKGIAPRNKAKLRQFDSIRIQRFIDLTAESIKDVNQELGRRRSAKREAKGASASQRSVIDAELGRDIMAALAHGILLARAPRSDNVLQARLDWVNWDENGARIVVPAAQVKLRGAGDADLTILLNDVTSKLLKRYLEVVRPALLQSGQERNPFLFPAQRGNLSRHYSTLLKQVTKLVHRKVGVSIHPHLYRHLVGWIWLRESTDNMPKVQRLLGHRKIETTIEYYAELDENLIGAEWMRYLDQTHEKTASKRKWNKK